MISRTLDGSTDGRKKSTPQERVCSLVWVSGSIFDFVRSTGVRHAVMSFQDNSSVGSHTIDQALCLFGRPASVTGFLRANRGVDSEIDDTFTIVMQYGENQKNLLITVKTAVVTHMRDQLKYWVRGTKGSYLKVSSLYHPLASPPSPFFPPWRSDIIVRKTTQVPLTSATP